VGIYRYQIVIKYIPAAGCIVSSSSSSSPPPPPSSSSSPSLSSSPPPPSSLSSSSSSSSCYQELRRIGLFRSKCYNLEVCLLGVLPAGWYFATPCDSLDLWLLYWRILRRYVVCEGTTNQLARLLQHIACTAPDLFNDCISRNMIQKLLLRCKCSLMNAGLLARSQYSEGPATGHLDRGFSWFPCV